MSARSFCTTPTYDEREQETKKESTKDFFCFFFHRDENRERMTDIQLCSSSVLYASVIHYWLQLKVLHTHGTPTAVILIIVPD